MEKIKVTRATMAELLKNADKYALEMAAIATPEQIERARRQNDSYEKGIEICSNCNFESLRVLNNCEFCGKDKLPF